MNKPGPFDRIIESSAQRDRSARFILIGMGIVGLILLVLVLPPLSLLSSEAENGDAAGVSGAGTGSGGGSLPALEDGFVALSLLLELEASNGTDDTTGPYPLEVSLIEPTSDERNLGLYTHQGGRWERLSAAQLVNNGRAARGEVDRLPANVAVLRRTSAAVQISGWLPAATEADLAVLDVLGTLNPVDFRPGPDGAVLGVRRQLPELDASVFPTVRTSSQEEVDAVNAILAFASLRDAHVSALVQLALESGNDGVDIDYRSVELARTVDFTVFVARLAERLHQASRSLSVTLPLPVRRSSTGWDTGAYDWEELAKSADLLKLAAEPDPADYFTRMAEVLAFLEPNVDLGKVSLIVSRQSREQASDGLRSLSLHEGLRIASAIEMRTTSPIIPNSKVPLIGKNIFLDEGASGLRWREDARAVSFTYQGRGGQRTVWLENSLSLAFKLDLAQSFGLAGVAIDDVSLDSEAPAIRDLLRAYADTGRVDLVEPNGPLLRPSWRSQAGSLDSSPTDERGNVVWQAPAQPGVYDISLIVSDGVIRASQKLVLEVLPEATAAPPP